MKLPTGIIMVDWDWLILQKNDPASIFTTRGGKKIFAGGGIAPDYFVPADTSRPGKLSGKLFVNGLLNDFGYKYYMGNPGLSNQYKTPGDFVKNFSLSDADWALFENLSAKDSISLSGMSAQEKAFISKTLKSSIAKQLFRAEGYFEVMNAGDENIKKAMEVLGK